MKLIGDKPQFTITPDTPHYSAALAALWVIFFSHGCKDIVNELETKDKAFEEWRTVLREDS